MEREKTEKGPMWNPRDNGERTDGGEGSVAVAIDRDKSSQLTLKWAVEYYIPRGATVKLVHVVQRPMSQTNLGDELSEQRQQQQQHLSTKSSQLFLSLRCLCMRRSIKSEVVLIEDFNVAKALVEYINQNSIGTMVLGGTSKKTITRFFKGEISSDVMRWAPDYCTVLVVNKGRLSAVRSATRPLPLLPSSGPEVATFGMGKDETPSVIEDDALYEETSTVDSDIRASSERRSTESSFLSFYENLRGRRGGREAPRQSFRTSNLSGMDPQAQLDSPSLSENLGRASASTENMIQMLGEGTNLQEEVEEVRRLKMELKKTMDMYHAACKEALIAKQRTAALEVAKNKSELRLQKKHIAEASTLLIVEREKSKCRAAMDRAEAAQRMAELEAERRMEAEMKAAREAEERKRIVDVLEESDVVLKYKSLLHILVVLFLLHFYLSVFK